MCHSGTSAAKGRCTPRPAHGSSIGSPNGHAVRLSTGSTRIRCPILGCTSSLSGPTSRARLTAPAQRGTALDLDRASDEQTPSRAAAALSRHRKEQDYDDEPASVPAGDSPILAFLEADIDRYIDDDLDGYEAKTAATAKG